MEKNFLLLIGTLIGAVILVLYLLKQPDIKKMWDETSLKLPIMGSLKMLFAVERFTSTMHILLDSGLPLVYTLEVSGRAAGNSFLEKNILAIKERVREGGTLSDEFRKLNIFPPMVSEMAKIGEETGSMPDVFDKVSNHYKKEVTVRVERLISAFEPLMILVMGVIIGGLVIALFLPLFQIATFRGGGGH